jgi:hypothetical protein
MEAAEEVPSVLTHTGIDGSTSPEYALLKITRYLHSSFFMNLIDEIHLGPKGGGSTPGGAGGVAGPQPGVVGPQRHRLQTSRIQPPKALLEFSCQKLVCVR